MAPIRHIEEGCRSISQDDFTTPSSTIITGDSLPSATTLPRASGTSIVPLSRRHRFAPCGRARHRDAHAGHPQARADAEKAAACSQQGHIDLEIKSPESSLRALWAILSVNKNVLT
jgi:hypothetical protein